MNKLSPPNPFNFLEKLKFRQTISLAAIAIGAVIFFNYFTSYPAENYILKIIFGIIIALSTMSKLMMIADRENSFSITSVVVSIIFLILYFIYWEITNIFPLYISPLVGVYSLMYVILDILDSIR